MNHLLISDLARAELSERLQAVQRERLARSADKAAGRPVGRIQRAVKRIRSSMSSWRIRTQLGAMPVPLCTDGCVESRTS
jgi:hypothetical protein